MGLNENSSGLTGAFDFLVIGETKLEVVAFSDKQHDEMHNWVRGEYLRRIELLQPSERVLTIATRTAVTLNYLEGEGQQLFISTEGLTYCLHLMTGKKKSVQECYEVLKANLENNPAQKIYDKWRELNLDPLKN